MTKIKRDGRSGKPTFKDWNLDALDRIGETVQDAVKEAMSEAMLHAVDNEGIEPFLQMNIEKPLIVTFDIPFGDDADPHGGPHFTFNLSEMIDDYIEEKHDVFFEKEYSDALVSELRRLADKIEASQQ